MTIMNISKNIAGKDGENTYWFHRKKRFNIS